MAYKISNSCLACDNCRPQCPAGAIGVEDGQYWINPAICDDCKNYDAPQCVVSCPLSLPTPAQAKRGRAKVKSQASTSPNLFLNGKNNPFASSIVIWEACNLLAQRQAFPWQQEDGQWFYRRHLSQGGSLTLQLANPSDLDAASPLVVGKAIAPIEAFDIRAACLHLIYAAHATALEKPWEQEFVISDRQIEEYLGLDKRKDLSKPVKLTLIKEIAQQPCLILGSIDCAAQGRIQGFSCHKEPLWHLLEIQHYFQDDEAGCKHLVGLTFKLRAGSWAKYFLNKQGCKDRTSFYQYSILPKSFLNTIMSIWQQHEGAARMMLWLLFKVRLGKEQRITVPTLMRVAYGEQRLANLATHREDRKRLLRTYESDLEVLNHHGLKPVFDPTTYPPEIQPLWAKLSNIPDDAEAALEFWMNDGSQDTRLTDASPRGKWNLLLNARIQWFELPPEWEQPLGELTKRKQRARNSTGKEASRRRSCAVSSSLTADQVMTARKSRGLSQRDLAERTGKSQSWIRDIENGRFCAKPEDQLLLKKVLGIG